MHASGFLACLQRRQRIDLPVAVVVAHPDDETLGVGASLALLPRLTLVHVTDGAPLNMRDAYAAGFETAEEYAAARRYELHCALLAVGVSPRLVSLGVRDQEAVRHIPGIVAQLREVLTDVALVITHAYEGGHPDHDTCALAVQRACSMLAEPPAILEFPAYHAAADGEWAAQAFLPNGPPGEAMPLDDAAVAGKRAALACFATQRDTLVRFDPGREVFRPAPRYDFAQPPHAGTLLYERFGWGMAGEQWREIASDFSASPGGLGPQAEAAKKMHILQVAYPFAPVGPDAVGGAEQVLSAIDHALIAAGHRCTVLACAGSQTAGELHAHTFPPGEIHDATRAQVHAQLRNTIAAVLRDEPIDLIHLHGVDFATYLPPPGPPCLITLHLPPSWYPRRALQPDRPETWLHCVSAAQHRACPPSDNLLPPIPNGVPVDTLSAHRHARRGFALTLGRICPEKGQHLALDAAHAAGLPLLLAGDVFAYAEHQAYFADCIAPRLDHQRRWLGPVGFVRKRRLLSAARCLLVPSLAEETASLVAMEALACGTPVIAFPSGALAELIEPGRTGFLVRDVADMAEAMHRVSEIDAETCRRTARECFPLRRMTDAYLARYAELARVAAPE